MLSTWPLAANATTHLPRGSESVATVPFASAWALWWTSDRAAHGFQRYWQAPIFHPAPDTFAMSEPLLLVGLAVTPLLWLGLPLALAYNLFLLGALVLNALSAALLLRALRLSDLAAFSGGALVCLLPVVHQELGVLTLVPLFGLVLALHAALRLSRAPRISRGLALGAALAASYLMCAQYALLAGIGLAPILIAVALRRMWRAAAAGGRLDEVAARAVFLRWLVAGAAAAIVFALAVAPLATAQLRVRSEQHFARTSQSLKRGGAFLRSYWKSPPEPLVVWPGLKVNRNSGTALYPGSLRMLLGVGVLAWAALARSGGKSNPRRVRLSQGRRRIVLFLGALIALEFFVSVSPNLRWGEYSLHDELAATVPGVRQIRSVWRAGVIVDLCIALLAAHALHFIYLRCKRSDRGRRYAGALGLALAVLATCEVWPPQQPLSPLPDSQLYATWADFMKRTLAPEEPYCFLPWVENDSVKAYEEVSRFMLLTALHGRPMVNGYSSYFPAPHERLAAGKPKFGDRRTAKRLQRYGVRYAVVRSSAVEGGDAGDWVRVFADPNADVSVYALRPEPP